MTDPKSRPAANRLAHETSAYLRQHMHNPVDWFPWGPEALARARAEDRPLLVSIGYSACHWCHVMAHESFEDPDTAALMNERFVNVKVDREERPDVDQLYMDTVVGLTGHGGWPLTAFCTPDGRPFYGGTYFPPEPRHGMPAFRDVLVGVSDAYASRREEVDDNAARIIEAIGRKVEGTAFARPGADTAVRAATAMLAQADTVNGGFGRAPKFPTPTSLDLLLAAIDVLPKPQGIAALEHVLRTCSAMARGGVYDQLGGGFHRYSVDASWSVPHFEKMLYDQGQLLRVYCETARRSPEHAVDLLWPVSETIAYLRREMTGSEGGFFASQDADSEGEEGTFYVWTPEQLAEELGDSATAFAETYGVSRRGNFEGATTVLADRIGKTRSHLSAERETLRRARLRRIAPDTDTKRVAAWNGLAVSGLARAAVMLEDASVLEDAVSAADFVLSEMRDEDGRLLRVWNAGRAHVPAFLDDLSAMLEATLDLHRAGAGDRFLSIAVEFADDIAKRFFDEEEGDFFLTPNDGEALPQRPRSDHDGATPHSTGLAVFGLLRVAELAGRDDLQRVVDRAIEANAFALERAPQAYPTLARAVLARERGISVAVIVGDLDDPRTHALADRARRVLLPEDAVVTIAGKGPRPPEIAESWLAGRVAVDGRPSAYVCRGRTCSLPIFEPERLAPFGDNAI